MVPTTISWTNETWNPTTGCTRISEGCRFCYAFALHDKRHAAVKNGAKLPKQYEKPFTELQLMGDDRLSQPLRWRKPRRIFVNSMSDLFHKDVPFEFIDRVFAVMALTPRHTYQILTKRPERMAEYTASLDTERIVNAAAGIAEEGDVFAANWIHGWSRPREMAPDGNPLDGTVWRWPLPNVHLGTSVEDQLLYEKRAPHLRSCRAAVRFLSCEPLLAPLTLALANGKIDWVIVGGESGPGARPFNLVWARSIREQCRYSGVAFFMKQAGAVVHYDYYADDRTRETMLDRPHKLLVLLWDRPGKFIEWEPGVDGQPPPGTIIEGRLNHSKGEDLSELPADLRVQEFPEPAGVTA